jgi:hypothetical protein
MQGDTRLPQGIDSESPPERAVLSADWAVRAFLVIGLSVAVPSSREQSPSGAAHSAP